MGVFGYSVPRGTGAPGLRPEEQGPQGLRQDPPGSGGSNLGGIPLGKEEATRPLSMVPES